MVLTVRRHEIGGQWLDVYRYMGDRRWMSNRPRRIFAAFVLAATLTGVGTVTGHAALGNAPAPPASVSPAPSSPPRPSDPVPPLPSGPTNPSPFPPTVPGDLHATAVHAGSVTLAWTASRGGCCGVDHYVVMYGGTFDDVVRTATVGNVTTATITSGISSRQQYYFRVSAVDDVNHQSGASNQVVVVTPASDTAADTTPPSPPGNLVATAVTSSGAALTWTPSTDDVGVVAYDVYRFDGWYTSQLAGSTTGTSYVAPTGGGRILFYVRARDAAGNVSIASNTVTTETTSAPPTTPPVTPACRAVYRTTSNWAGGFVAEVSITNTGPSPMDGWALAFTFGGDQRISSAWNAGFAQSGATVTLTDATWNRTLPPGATATAGVLGSWKSSNAAPTAFTLNGAACA
jgi:cellulose 1,4-beta-cellobiosidase